MAMGQRRVRQEALFVPAGELARSPGHPFYERLNEVLEAASFDRFVEERCAQFYAERMGRPGLAPGVYFRTLLVGYFEGLGSEREIAWRCADSLALRSFLGYGLDGTPPDHSTLSRTRRLIDLETHREVFAFVLSLLSEKGLLKGKTLGIDATTLEANAALRSIVRRDDGRGYDEYLEDLAEDAGIGDTSREERADLDRKRPKRTSNAEWVHPDDPDARVTKMKDGRTHLAHKAEHAVDLETGAIVGVTIQPADRGDTESLRETLSEACDQLQEAGTPKEVEEVVLDRGYHSNDVLTGLSSIGIRSYAAEPRRGRRRWRGKPAERDAVYANRRRLMTAKAGRLMRRRCELVERSFAHALETGGLRRTQLRGHDNIAKRYLVHIAAANLGLLMRTLTGMGTPKGLAAGLSSAMAAVRWWIDAILALLPSGETREPIGRALALPRPVRLPLAAAA